MLWAIFSVHSDLDSYQQFLDLFLSYFLSTEDPSGKRRKREDLFDDISLKNKPEKELTCKFRIRIIIFPKATRSNQQLSQVQY